MTTRLRRAGVLLGAALVLAACGGGGSSGPVVLALQTIQVLTQPQGPESPFGTTLGGDTLQLSGTGFVSGATVVVGAQPAAIQQLTANQILVTSPPGAVGFATVTVTNPGGDTTSLADVFHYIAPPTVLSVVALDGPTAGEKRAPIAGGVTIQATGLEFRDGIAFEVEGRPVVATRVDDTTATFLAPSVENEQTADVTAIDPTGLAGTAPGALFYTQEFSLDPQSDSLSEGRARHLFRRAGFAAPPARIAQAVQDGLAATVTALLDYRNDPQVEAEALTLYGANPPPADAYNDRVNKQWWLHLMLHNTNPLQERMAYFLHDHFATSERDMAASFRWTMHHQVQLFRRFTLGADQTLADGSPGLGYDWKRLLIEVSKDRAMLDWLDGRVSRVGAPNENYARELWELFMLGEGNGYTEDDIKQAAKAFTGFLWLRKTGQTYLDVEYRPGRHDANAKTIFGVTGFFGYDDIEPFMQGDASAKVDARDTDGGIVSLTLAQRPVDASRFICRKLADFFLYDVPDDIVVDELARRLRAPGRNQWNLRPILETILRSKAFFSSRAIKGKVQSPVEYALTFLRSTEIELSPNITTNASRLRTALIAMGQVVLAPPDVSGWPSGLLWMAAQSQLERFNFVTQAVEELDDVALDIDPLLPPAGQRGPQELVDHLAALFDVQLSGNARAKLTEYVTTQNIGDATNPNFVPFAFDPTNDAHLKMKVRGLVWMIAQYHDRHRN